MVSELEYVQSLEIVKKYKRQKLNQLKLQKPHLTTSISNFKWELHIQNCCIQHGCSFGYSDCPVELGLVEQKNLCDWCSILD